MSSRPNGESMGGGPDRPARHSLGRVTAALVNRNGNGTGVDEERNLARANGRGNGNGHADGNGHGDGEADGNGNGNGNGAGRSDGVIAGAVSRVGMKELELDLGRYLPYEPTPGIGRWKYEKKLPLTTAGQLRLAAVGVGSAFSARNYQSNFILIKGTTALFVDLGSTAMVRLVELGLGSHDIRDLLITHSHADHIGSLEEVALRRRYEAPFIEMPKLAGESQERYLARLTEARQAGNFRPNLYVPETYAHDLWEMSLRGGLAFSEEVDFLGPRGMMQLDHYFKVINPEYEKETSSWVADVKGIKVRSFLTQHVPDTAVDSGMYTSGLVIDDKVFISGDTKFDPENIERYAQGCEVLLHDCQHFPGGVHAFYGDMKTLPAEIKAKMWLYHLSDGMLSIDVRADGFGGLLRPAPVVYDIEG